MSVYYRQPGFRVSTRIVKPVPCTNAHGEYDPLPCHLTGLRSAVRCNAWSDLPALGFCIRPNRQSFSKHNPVTVWSDNGKFAHSPWLFRELVPYLHSILHRLLVQTRCVADVKV